MTWGLVGWCFSRRTHRRGRMITCKARAARCTRKPSPRPLPGWHFPKPASKFSLSTAVTHVNVPNEHTHVHTHTQNWHRIDNYTGHQTYIHTEKERNTIWSYTIDTIHLIQTFFFCLFLSLSLSLSFYLPFYLTYLRLTNYLNTPSIPKHRGRTYVTRYLYLRTYIAPHLGLLVIERISLLVSTMFVFVYLFCLDFA